MKPVIRLRYRFTPRERANHVLKKIQKLYPDLEHNLTYDLGNAVLTEIVNDRGVGLRTTYDDRDIELGQMALNMLRYDLVQRYRTRGTVECPWCARIVRERGKQQSHAEDCILLEYEAEMDFISDLFLLD